MPFLCRLLSVKYTHALMVIFREVTRRTQRLRTHGDQEAAYTTSRSMVCSPLGRQLYSTWLMSKSAWKY